MCSIRVEEPYVSSRRSGGNGLSSSSMSSWGFRENKNESEEKNKYACTSESNHFFWFCLVYFVFLIR